MLISPINSIKSNVTNLNYSKKINLKNNPEDDKQINNSSINNICFYANPNLKVLENRYKILLTQNIWKPRLDVKMPENEIEKKVLLEVLQRRLKLDEYARLTEKRFSIITDDSDENKESALKKLEEEIKLTSQVNRASLQYFKDIEKLADEYLDKKLIKISQMEKFYSQIKKQNINKNGEYSTAELIEIIKSGKAPEKVAVKEAGKTENLVFHSKKELISAIEAHYEKTLRSMINIYIQSNNYEVEAYVSRQAVEGKFKEALKKYPDVAKNINKIYENIEKRYIYKHNKLADVLYPKNAEEAKNKQGFANLNKIWQEMRPIEDEMKKVIKDIESLKSKQKTSPKDKAIAEQLEEKEDKLGELKDKWLFLMMNSVKWESHNYKIAEDLGMKETYNYLVDENPIVKKHFFAFKNYIDNDKHITDEYWETEILQIKPKKQD